MLWKWGYSSSNRAQNFKARHRTDRYCHCDSLNLPSKSVSLWHGQSYNYFNLNIQPLALKPARTEHLNWDFLQFHNGKCHQVLDVLEALATWISFGGNMCSLSSHFCVWVWVKVKLWNWSAHRHIQTKICNKLSPETTEKLVYVDSNNKLAATVHNANDLKMFAWDNEDVQQWTPALCAACSDWNPLIPRNYQITELQNSQAHILPNCRVASTSTLTLAEVHFLYWKLGVNRSIKYKIK